MKKIEMLFPEICNLFGNMYNIKYLQETSDEIEVIYTDLTTKPKFLDEEIDMVYMSPMTEKSQELVINALKPYKEEIKKKIEDRQIFLVIGNALEIFGDYIENEDGSKLDALGLTGLYAKRDLMHRYNSLFLGEFENMKIEGFKSQFSMSYGNNSENYLFDTIRGDGINKETKYEGIRINNFMGTYVLGPLLVVNPEFTKYILKLMKLDIDNVAFEEIDSNITYKAMISLGTKALGMESENIYTYTIPNTLQQEPPWYVYPDTTGIEEMLREIYSIVPEETTDGAIEEGA